MKIYRVAQKLVSHYHELSFNPGMLMRPGVSEMYHILHMSNTSSSSTF